MKTALNLTILTILKQVMDLQVLTNPTNLTISSRQPGNLAKLLPHPIRPSTFVPSPREASAGGLHYTRLLLSRTVRQSRSGVPPLFWAGCALAWTLECIINSRVRQGL